MTKTKRYSSKVMEIPVTFMVSEGMFLKLKERKRKDGESHSFYLRELIKNDLKIDEHGNPQK